MSEPVPAIDLRSEIADADLIVVGTITTVSDAHDPVSLVIPHAEPTNDQLRVAELAVVRILAGEHDRGVVRIFLVGKSPSRLWMELTEGQTVLLFLRSAGGAYLPVKPAGNPIQTLPEIDPPPAGSSRTRAVAHELEQIILTADPTSGASLIVQASLARVGLRGDVDYHLLGTSALQNPVRRAAWVAIALAEGEVEALDDVPALFAHRAEPPVDVLWNLIVQKVSELRAPAARPQLAALLQSASVELARAATVALRQLHDPATMPDLTEALDNADQEVRYQAVMGLAELNPDVGAGPAYNLYRANEPEYIEEWKQWWEASRKSRANL